MVLLLVFDTLVKVIQYINRLCLVKYLDIKKFHIPFIINISRTMKTLEFDIFNILDNAKVYMNNIKKGTKFKFYVIIRN